MNTAASNIKFSATQARMAGLMPSRAAASTMPSSAMGSADAPHLQFGNFSPDLQDTVEFGQQAQHLGQTDEAVHWYQTVFAQARTYAERFYAMLALDKLAALAAQTTQAITGFFAA